MKVTITIICNGVESICGLYKGVEDRKKALKVYQSVLLKCFSCFLVVFHDDHFKSAVFVNNGSQIFWSKFLKLVRCNERIEGIEDPKTKLSISIHNLSINRWKKDLSEKEIDTAVRILGLTFEGYEFQFL